MTLSATKNENEKHDDHVEESSHDEEENPQQETQQRQEPPYLVIDDTIKIYFQDRWDVSSTNIGSGLWSTGIAMAHFFLEHPYEVICGLSDCIIKKERFVGKQVQDLSVYQSILTQSRYGNETIHGLRAIELGSGNGFLSTCFLASLLLNHTISNNHFDDDGLTTAGSERSLVSELVVTDLLDHFPYMKQTLISDNVHIWDLSTKQLNINVSIQSYKWGNENDNNHNIKAHSYDFIFGSDLAYRTDLYEPLVESMMYLSHANTKILLGVTKQDTSSIFLIYCFKKDLPTIVFLIFI